jgi:hypothetical protein
MSQSAFHECSIEEVAVIGTLEARNEAVALLGTSAECMQPGFPNRTVGTRNQTYNIENCSRMNPQHITGITNRECAAKEAGCRA